MTIAHAIIFSVKLEKFVKKYSFFGLFRFGEYVFVKLKICCDYKGNTFHTVVQGPLNWNYEKILGDDYKKAKENAILQWHNSQITSRILINHKHTPNPFDRKLQRTRRSIDGIIKVENALEPKEEAVTEVIHKNKYTKQKTIEYVETDAPLGEQTRIFGRQTRIVRKNEEIL
jgi:hypothetical protein